MLPLRAVGTVALTLGCAAILLGCPLLKKKGDASAEEDEPVADAATITVTGSGAKNEGSVLRYAKETKLADEPATISRDATKVREFPGTGKEVATLPTGTAVTKIAKYFSTGVLVVFDDPSHDGTKLMGWIPPESIAVAATAATTATATATGVPTLPVVRVDAGPPRDAGAVAIVDAGKDSGSAPVDAGGGTAACTAPPAAAAQLSAPPACGNEKKCPVGFELIGPFCRRPCTTEAQCPRNIACLPTPGATKKSCTMK